MQALAAASHLLQLPPACHQPESRGIKPKALQQRLYEGSGPNPAMQNPADIMGIRWAANQDSGIYVNLLVQMQCRVPQRSVWDGRGCEGTGLPRGEQQQGWCWPFGPSKAAEDRTGEKVSVALGFIGPLAAGLCETGERSQKVSIFKLEMGSAGTETFSGGCLETRVMFLVLYKRSLMCSH